MIRAIGTSNGHPPVYGLTVRGLAVLAGALGVLLAAIVLSVLAFRATGESTRNRIETACRESNRRHVEAIPVVIGLAKAPQPGSSSAERAATVEAIKVLEARLLRRPSPKLSAEGKVVLDRIEAFAQVLAPAYNCADRVAQLSKT